MGKEIKPYIGEGNYVFISYSHVDKELVEKDIVELQKRGANIWFDAGINAGEDWEKFVESKITSNRCSAIVFYLSKNSIISPAVLKEIRIALPNSNENTKKEFFTINVGNESVTSMILNSDTNSKKTLSSETISLLLKNFSDNVIFIGRDYKIGASNHINSMFDNLIKYNVIHSVSNTNDFVVIEEGDYAVLVEYQGMSPVVNIPDVSREGSPIKKIGDAAFFNNDKIRIIEFGSYIEIIEKNAFLNCVRLEKVILDNNLKVICESAFENCYLLKELELPKSLELINTYAFRNTNIFNLVIPSSIRKLCAKSIPGNIKTIHFEKAESFLLDYHFIDDENDGIVRHIYFGENKREDITFISSTDQEGKINNFMRHMEKGDFANGNTLVYVSYENFNSFIDEVHSNNIFAILDKPTNLILINNTISWDNVKGARKYLISINDDPFIIVDTNSYKFDIIDDVLEIKIYALGKRADSLLQSVASDSIIIGVTPPKYLDTFGTGSALYFYNGNNPNVILPDNIDDLSSATFSSDSRIEFIKFSNSISIIESFLLVGHALTKIYIPSSVKIIKEEAFAYNKKLQDVIIEEGIQTIENNAFLLCTSLNPITIPNSLVGISRGMVGRFNNALIKIKDSNKSYIQIGDMIYDCSYKTLIQGENVKIPQILDSIDTISEYAFSFFNRVVTLPALNNLKTIKINAFSSCDGLKTIDLKNVHTIEGGAFANCNNLERVNLGNSITFLGEYSFAKCSSLKNIVIPKNLINIHPLAFSGTNLDSLVFSENYKVTNDIITFLNESLPNLNFKKLILPKNNLVSIDDVFILLIVGGS
jgi:hypothetical protein